MMETFKEFEGKLTSLDVSEKLAALHARKATVNAKVAEYQAELFKLKRNDMLTEESREQMNNAKQILNNYLAEQGQLNERISEFSILQRCSIDQILLQLFKERHNNIFKNLLMEAENIYLIKTKNHKHDQKKGSSKH